MAWIPRSGLINAHHHAGFRSEFGTADVTCTLAQNGGGENYLRFGLQSSDNITFGLPEYLKVPVTNGAATVVSCPMTLQSSRASAAPNEVDTTTS